jgi:sugar phosphate isomerase/epimerase
MIDLSYQLYSSREFPPLPATFRMLKSHGIDRVEGYGGVYEDLAGLVSMLKSNGMTMQSGHFGIDMIESDPDRVIEIAGLTGMKAVYCPYLLPEQRPVDKAGWHEFGKRLDAAGSPLRAAGLTFGWHNHDFEFRQQEDGSIAMEEILAGGPSLTWEADIAWIIRGGADPFDWIARHGGRISAVHVKDIAPSGQNGDEDGWADVGHGTVDWKRLFAALKKTPAEIFVLEHDKPSDHERFTRRSVAAVRAIQE